MKKFVLLAAVFAASQAHAATYDQVVADKSAVQFTYQQMGVKVDGRFPKFAAQISFDPARPAGAKASLDLELGAIDAGSRDANKEAIGKTFLDVKGFPSANFTATGIRETAPNHYDVAGRLTIKGRTQELVIPATFTPQGKTGVLEGSFTVHRGDFAIGEGAWAKFDILANDIVVRFRLTTSATK